MAVIHFMSTIIRITLLVASTICAYADTPESALFDQAHQNGLIANEGFRRSLNFVEGWKRNEDPQSGLIPRNHYNAYWNAKDAAADNYPFMVLTTWFTDRDQFNGRMKRILAAETKLTSSVDSLPDTFDFKTQQIVGSDLQSIMFGASEYIKDGLLPLTEWLGHSEWSARMLTMLDDMWKHAPVETPYGKIVSTDIEVNGEMLQVLSRMYWMMGEDKYLEWATRLGDYYLLGDKHPKRNTKHLRLRDHGCEVVSGLCELYATLSVVDPAKKAAYKPHIHEMLDRILEVGRNEDGLFYDSINPVDGTVISEHLADTWGYNMNAYYTVYFIDGVEAYREAPLKALSNLHKYKNHNWERGGADGNADSIESALNLYNRERVDGVPAWLDSEIQVMWAMQRADGVIAAIHPDGNFARTTIIYNLWKSQGACIHPWRSDVTLGAVEENGALYLSLSAADDWSGEIFFDTARHREVMHLPFDWPRINQFPEWFPVNPEAMYSLKNESLGSSELYEGIDLIGGVKMNLEAGEHLSLRLSLK